MPRIHTTPDGIRYTLRHERPTLRYESDASTDRDAYFVYPKGGHTVVTIIDANDQPVVTGEAICNPKLDNFSYKRGHQIALGRALKAWRALPAVFVGDDGSVAHFAPGGRALTNEDIQTLVDEAEEGYDVSQVKPRQPGDDVPY